MTLTYIEGYACAGKGEALKPWKYTARPLGPHDIGIKISHCGICGSDIHTLDSGWGHTNYPCIVGHEIIGVVQEVGSQVSTLQIGDRVGVGAQVLSCLNHSDCKACASGHQPLCSKGVYTYNSKYEDGNISYGGYAEAVRVDEHFAFKIPENIPSDQAAPLLCAGITVYAPLKKHGAKPGVRVGVAGIGGLGHLGIQFAKVLGATVVAVSHSASKKEESKTLGATEFVNMSDPVSVKSVNGTLDILLLTANYDNMKLDEYLDLLAMHGKLIMVGVPETPVNVDPKKFIMAEKSITGSLIGGIEEIKEMLKVASEKNVRPIIQKFPMSEVNKGLELVRSGKVRYRVVLEN